jgi:hypothetical protein
MIDCRISPNDARFEIQEWECVIHIFSTTYRIPRIAQSQIVAAVDAVYKSELPRLINLPISSEGKALHGGAPCRAVPRSAMSDGNSKFSAG